jgi:hypothetical protein
MIPAALKGWLMSSEEEKGVPAVLHALMWASMFGAVDAIVARKYWTAVVVFLFGLACEAISGRWPDLRVRLGPSVALPVERVAGNRRYQKIARSLVLSMLIVGLGYAIYVHYSRALLHITTPMVMLSGPHLPEEVNAALWRLYFIDIGNKCV